MKVIKCYIFLFIIFNFIHPLNSIASLSKEDLKEIREIIRDEVGIYSHQIDKRFEQIDKRFEDMNSKINLLATIFTAMFLGTIGFALWDRRTMIRPFETKVKEIETGLGLEKNERVKLTESLKELAKNDPKLQVILRNFNIL